MVWAISRSISDLVIVWRRLESATESMVTSGVMGVERMIEDSEALSEILCNSSLSFGLECLCEMNMWSLSCGISLGPSPDGSRAMSKNLFGAA